MNKNSDCDKTFKLYLTAINENTIFSKTVMYLVRRSLITLRKKEPRSLAVTSYEEKTHLLEQSRDRAGGALRHVNQTQQS